MEQPNSFKRIMVQIWPTVNRVITSIVYFIFSVIRSIVKGAIAQLKGM